MAIYIHIVYIVFVCLSAFLVHAQWRPGGDREQWKGGGDSEIHKGAVERYNSILTKPKSQSRHAVNTRNKEASVRKKKTHCALGGGGNTARHLESSSSVTQSQNGEKAERGSFIVLDAVPHIYEVLGLERGSSEVSLRCAVLMGAGRSAAKEVCYRC